MTLLIERRTPDAPAPTSRRRHLHLRIEPRYLILALAAAIVAYLALVPMVTMLIASLKTTFLGTGPSHWTLANYPKTFTSTGFGTLVANSFIYAGATAVVCTIVGFGLAWLVARTNAPAKGFAIAVALVPLIIPGIVNTTAWALLLSPEQGPLNNLLRDLHLPIFNIYSMPGMVFVQSIHVAPLAFLMGVAAFSSLDSSLEEAALASGSSPLHTFRVITLRMVRPAIFSAGLLMFIQAISTFEVPELIGVPGHKFVFVSKIYDALQQFPADYGTVGVIGVFVLVIAIVGLVLSQWMSHRSATQTITGKGFRPTLQDLGRWRWAGFAVFLIFFLIAVVLPMAMIIWSSLLPAYKPPSIEALHLINLNNYREIWHQPKLIDSLKNSAVTAVTAGLIVTLLSAVVAYITVKTKIFGRKLLDGLATVPIAVPSIIMGVGILYWYLVAPLPVHLYGTLTILIIAFVTISLPYGMRYVVPGMEQIHTELEEAATASGASWPHTFRRVFIPLLIPSLLAAFLYTMIVSFREISAAIFLYSTGSQVVSVTIYNLWENGTYTIVAALGVIMVACLCVAVIAVRLITKRFGRISAQ